MNPFRQSRVWRDGRWVLLTVAVCVMLLTGACLLTPMPSFDPLDPPPFGNARDAGPRSETPQPPEAAPPSAQRPPANDPQRPEETGETDGKGAGAETAEKHGPDPSAPAPPTKVIADNAMGARELSQSEKHQGSPSSTVEPAPATAAADNPPTAAPFQDLCGQLRAAPPRAAARNWSMSAEALRHLKTLDGAYFDARTRQLVLVGQYSETPGPFEPEDLPVVMRARFLEATDPGVTIDPIQGNKTGPEMEVKFFGGARDTHLGQLMFECDRLMKCLSLGRDNVTKAPVVSAVEGFHTLPFLSLRMGPLRSSATWARFWIVPALDQIDGPDGKPRRLTDKDPEGKPVIALSADCCTIAFEQWRLYVRTEKMRDSGNDKALVSAGEQDPAARRFADHLTANYAKIAAEFPPFAQLYELAKLVVVADWAYRCQLPIDHEMLYVDFSSPTSATPMKTPTLSVSDSVEAERHVRQVTLFGGVTLEPKTFMAEDRQGHAKDLADRVAPHLEEAHHAGLAHWEARDGRPYMVAGWPAQSRAPPTLAPVPLAHSSGQARISVRKDSGTKFAFTAAGSGGTAKYGMPVLIDQTTGEETLDLPLLRKETSKRVRRHIEITTGQQHYTVYRPEFLYVTSPHGRVNIGFNLAKPNIDLLHNEPYFPADVPGIKGYYPQSNKVVGDDGTEFHFQNGTGLLTGISGGGKPRVSIVYHQYQDGPLRLAQRVNANLGARPPPTPSLAPPVLRPSQGEAAPSVKLSSPAKLLLEIRNLDTGTTFEVRQKDMKLSAVEEPATVPR